MKDDLQGGNSDANINDGDEDVGDGMVVNECFSQVGGGGVADSRHG